MEKVHVIKVESEGVKFNNGMELSSDHHQDCCESHYLSFSDLSINDFEGLEFNLTNDNFFLRLPGYGIELRPITGHPVRVPGYGYNNGYYSSQLTLALFDGKNFNKTFDITDCQVITE